MNPGALDLGFISATLFVALVLLFGLFTLFVRGENIERNVLVGGLTIATALIAAALLVDDYRRAFPYGGATLLSIALVSVLGYAVGRGIDYLLGPAAPEPASTEGTLGADLAD